MKTGNVYIREFRDEANGRTLQQKMYVSDLRVYLPRRTKEDGQEWSEWDKPMTIGRGVFDWMVKPGKPKVTGVEFKDYKEIE